MMRSLQRVFAIAGLTIKAVFRLRLVVTLALALFAVTLLLPFLIKHNGTAKMFAQVLLTYSLYLCFGILGLATLWMSCGLHATDMEPGQLQLLAVKPAARWQIWLGRWIGILIINTFLLAAAASLCYALLCWKARLLTPGQQAILRQEILVARSGLREPVPDLAGDVERMFALRVREQGEGELDPELIRRELRDQARARLETTPPNYLRMWDIDFRGRAPDLAGQVLHLRVRFQSALRDPDAMAKTVWLVGNRATGRFWRETKELAPGVFHEFAIPADLLDSTGKLHIECENRAAASILFPLEDGMEALFRDGSFAGNYACALIIISCWLGLLAALGLASGSFLSFAVAAMFSLCLVLVGMSGDTLSEMMENGTVLGVDHDTGENLHPTTDRVLLPAYQALRSIIAPVGSFSPITALSEGRAIGAAATAAAAAQIVLLGGGFFAAVGILVFTRRELAIEPAQT